MCVRLIVAMRICGNDCGERQREKERGYVWCCFNSDEFWCVCGEENFVVEGIAILIMNLTMGVYCKNPSLFKMRRFFKDFESSYNMSLQFLY